MSEKHEVLLRLKAVELLAYWEGRVVTNRLVEWFNISRQQASHDIKRYIQERNPESLIYSPVAKGYIPTARFSPVLSSGHINEYLELVAGIEGELLSVTLESKEHLAAVQLPDRSVEPLVVREVLKACRSNQVLSVLYASMNNPVPHRREISPHTLIYTGFRWHIRGFCHTNNDYRDFLLSRISDPQTSKAAYKGSEPDGLWNENVTFELVPNPNLSDPQRALVQRDFCMADGCLSITVRKALAHYALLRYQAGITETEQHNALKYPIVVAEGSRAVIGSLLFGNKDKSGVDLANQGQSLS